MEGRTGTITERPEDYASEAKNEKIAYSELIDKYNHYRRITKRILKNMKDFDGLPYEIYKKVIERVYPPVTKIRSKEFLNIYMSKMCNFLVKTRGNKYGYKDKV